MQRAASETEAANGALALIGEPPIASLTEPRAAARVCNERFADVRDALLREYEWNFAGAWVVPAADPQRALGPLKIRYPLPEDCLYVRSIAGLETGEWEIEASAVTPASQPILTGVLVTNAAAPNVNYTRRIENPTLWDALFLQIFELRLAAAVNPQVGRDAGMTASLKAEARLLIATAKRRDAQEKARSYIRSDVPWLAARRGFRSLR